MMSPEMQRIQLGLNNIITLGKNAIGRDTMPASVQGLHEIIRFAKQQVRYIDSIKTTG